MKTQDERDVINAIARVRRLKSSRLAFDAMAELLDRRLVDRAALEAYRQSEFMRGFRAGADDANGVAE